MVKHITKIAYEGFIEVFDAYGNTLLETKNDIHSENSSIAIAKALAQRTEGHFFEMAFGNGGSQVSAVSTVTYLEPNTIEGDATLYNETFSKPILFDNMEIRHVPGELFTDIVIRLPLEFGEPAGQRAFDDALSLEEDFVFDEIGIRTADGLLFSHAIFSPIQKALNRVLTFKYTIRISRC